MNAMNPAAAELVTITVDGVSVSVPKGTMIIRAAEQIGIQIPRFCDHPLLKPVAACRQCLVEVAMPDREGNVRKMPKPQPACAMAVAPKMEVYTQYTSEVARKAQEGMLEFLLINHPLDCPVCDKGGECPLQNQALAQGPENTRFTDVKRTFPKPIRISTQILLDRDRCVLCQRCTRFSAEIAGDPFIALQGRGGGTPGYGIHELHGSQIGRFDAAVLDYDAPFSAARNKYAADDAAALDEGAYLSVDFAESYSGPGGDSSLDSGLRSGPVGVSELDASGRPFASYFAGNTIQICPVGALTSAAYRFRSRPFDLVSTASVAENDSSGSAIRVDQRRGVVLRRQSGDDPEVNEEWITDKDRFAFRWATGRDRLSVPLVRDEVSGQLVATSWEDALDVAGRALSAAIEAKGAGFLPGGRLTMEDAYAWSKFARLVGRTNDIDHRARTGGGEEEAFAGALVAGTGMGVTYRDLENAPHVLAVGFEAEEEVGTVFLRLRKAHVAGKGKRAVIASWASAGTRKMGADWIPAAPGTEAEVLDAIRADAPDATLVAQAEGLGNDGAIIIVGERAALTPGTYSAAVRLSERTGARIAWIPRRIGERAGYDAGTTPALLPWGRPVADATARVDVASVWAPGESLPATPGRDTAAIIEAAASGELSALVVGGIDSRDVPSPARLTQALQSVGTVIQLEVRRNDISEHATVVLPVAPPVEKAGTFINWEGRPRPFGAVLSSHQYADRVVLDELAHEMGIELGLSQVDNVHRELMELGAWDGVRLAVPEVSPTAPPTLAAGEAVLATHKLMLDMGRSQDYEPHLAGTAQRAVARLSPASAAAIGLSGDDGVRISGMSGDIVLPVVITDMTDHVIWVPQNSRGSSPAVDAGVRAGDVVRIEAVPAAELAALTGDEKRELVSSAPASPVAHETRSGEGQ